LRTAANNQLLLLAYSFENFYRPFKAYYDRLFMKKLRESKLRERLLEGGLSEGGAIITTKVVNELDVDDVVEVEGVLMKKQLRRKLTKDQRY
jgi:hypothetical protein